MSAVNPFSPGAAAPPLGSCALPAASTLEGKQSLGPALPLPNHCPSGLNPATLLPGGPGHLTRPRPPHSRHCYLPRSLLRDHGFYPQSLLSSSAPSARRRSLTTCLIPQLRAGSAGENQPVGTQLHPPSHFLRHKAALRPSADILKPLKLLLPPLTLN